METFNFIASCCLSLSRFSCFYWRCFWRLDFGLVLNLVLFSFHLIVLPIVVVSKNNTYKIFVLSLVCHSNIARIKYRRPTCGNEDNKMFSCLFFCHAMAWHAARQKTSQVFNCFEVCVQARKQTIRCIRRLPLKKKKRIRNICTYGVYCS